MLHYIFRSGVSDNPLRVYRFMISAENLSDAVSKAVDRMFKLNFDQLEIKVTSVLNDEFVDWVKVYYLSDGVISAVVPTVSLPRIVYNF